MQGTFDVKDLFTVAARLKRMNKAFIDSDAFEIDFTTLMDLIDKLKKQNDK